MDRWTLPFALLFGFAWICEANVNPYVLHPVPYRPQLPPSMQRSDNLTLSDCRFALHFYQALGSSLDGNVVFSPLSLQTVLGAVTEGARGATAEELLHATNRTIGDLPATRERTRRLLEQLNQGSPHHSLTIASRLYLHDGFTVRTEFVNALANYGMHVIEADFQMPQSAELEINQWVSQVTNGHIGVLVPPGTLDVQTRLVLVNAIFFKADWETTFPAENTRLRPFYFKRNKAVQVPTMTVQGDFLYGDFPKFGFEMLELPYDGRNFSMVVALPYAGKSLAAVARRLAQRPALLANPGRRMAQHSTTVYLPKFRLEMSVNGKQVLEHLGVRLPFEAGRCDLTGISPEGQLHVSDVLHKAAIEVTERGTKASAASAVVIKGRSMNSDPVFQATRPFLFFVRHNPSATVLFLGHVRHFKDASPLPRSY